ncbi:type 4a pilus biogenesis protein PilO [Petrachloros mirabilis]
MKLSEINLDVLRTIPLKQKLALLTLTVAGILAAFYYQVVEPKSMEIVQLEEQVGKLDREVSTLTIKVKHLDELIAASKQLEIELAKKKERLPPEEEAVMLLKQVSDLAIRLGLDIKLWKPNGKSEDPSKLFVRLPVNVEVSGGYHTAALFFDRINNLPRIITVSNLKMGSPRTEKGRVVTQTVFDLVAFAAPQESINVASAAPVVTAK